jgi:hypothetical protein
MYNFGPRYVIIIIYLFIFLFIFFFFYYNINRTVVYQNKVSYNNDLLAS